MQMLCNIEQFWPKYHSRKPRKFNDSEWNPSNRQEKDHLAIKSDDAKEQVSVTRERNENNMGLKVSHSWPHYTNNNIVHNLLILLQMNKMLWFRTKFFYSLMYGWYSISYLGGILTNSLCKSISHFYFGGWSWITVCGLNHLSLGCNFEVSDSVQ